MDRLEQQIKFIIEVDKLKSIIRQNYLADGSRKEDDADHSWHLALMCAILAENANEKIDVLKTMKMVLIHDIVEIDAGDTYAYDPNPGASVSKRERELEAADRIFNLLPKDQAEELRALWDEFEENETPEAKFAATLDRVQPFLLNSASDGKSWKEHKVSFSQVLKRNTVTPDGSKVLWDYVYEMMKQEVEKGNLVNE